MVTHCVAIRGFKAISGTVLGSVQIPSDTNESKTALAMVRNLVVKGRLIVGDAAYGYRDSCETIIDSGDDVRDHKPAPRTGRREPAAVPACEAAG